MSPEPKTSQIQIRVSRSQKKAIQQAANRGGLDVSAFILSRVLSIPAVQFQECMAACALQPAPSFALAELNSLLSRSTPGELREMVAEPPAVALTPFLSNYVAAMVEYGCGRRSMSPPAWTRAVVPLEQPVFGTELLSLRLHLLTRAPAPFRRRNIFIDTSLGGRV